LRKEKLDELNKLIAKANKELEESGDSSRIFYDYKVITEERKEKEK